MCLFFCHLSYIDILSKMKGTSFDTNSYGSTTKRYITHVYECGLYHTHKQAYHAHKHVLYISL